MNKIVVCTFVVTITNPPESMTVCSGSDVLLRCGYQSTSPLPVTWMINGTSFDQSAIANSPLYQLNNPATPRRVSLTVFSINHTTTFQCIIQLTSSRIQTVTVTTGRYVCIAIYCMCIVRRYVCTYACM